MEIKKNEPLKNHTSFKIGGPADEFSEVNNEKDIVELIKYAKEKGIPYTIMGNGSNLLVSDKGIRGLVIKLAKGFESNIKIHNNEKEADAKRLLSIMGLGAVYGTELIFKIEGSDEEMAQNELLALLNIIEGQD